MPRKTNPFGRTVQREDAYATYVGSGPTEGWTWYVCKTYQHPDNEDGMSRWFCYVSSPHTFGGFDLGDVYRQDVLGNAHLHLAKHEWHEAMKAKAEGLGWY